MESKLVDNKRSSSNSTYIRSRFYPFKSKSSNRSLTNLILPSKFQV